MQQPPNTPVCMLVEVRRLPHALLLLPDYQSAGASGIDLPAAVPEGEAFVIEPGEVAFVPTGIALAIPAGFEGQVRPRSGLATRKRLVPANTPGTIDSDFRGEVLVALENRGTLPQELRRGDRIAQLVIAPVMRCYWQEVTTLPPSDRGAGAFGSTG